MVLKEEKKGIEKKFFDLCEGVVHNLGLRIYDLDYDPRRSFLRLYILNPQSKTALLEDCINVDQALTPFIDNESWISESLVLEVSSPGVFRHLKTKEHFKEGVGEWVALVLSRHWGEDKRESIPASYFKKKKLRGILKSAGDESLILEQPDAELEIFYQEIKKANIDPDL